MELAQYAQANSIDKFIDASERKLDSILIEQSELRSPLNKGRGAI
jgi:hypothetical protein